MAFKLSEEGKDTAKKLILNTQDFSWDYSPVQPGLFGACLLGGGGWGAGLEFLACSVSVCRVVVISGEATSQKILDEYANKLTQERDKRIAQIKDKCAKAEAVLKGEK